MIRKISNKLKEAELPVNYYPGTNETIVEAMAAYPFMERYGKRDNSHQPRVLVKCLETTLSEIAFQQFWSSFMAQTFIDGETTEDYLENAEKFANEKLWGTLAETLTLDSKTEKKLTKMKILPLAID